MKGFDFGVLGRFPMGLPRFHFSRGILLISILHSGIVCVCGGRGDFTRGGRGGY